MCLYKEILIKILEKEDITVKFENFIVNPKEMMEIISYQALKRIKDILEDERLGDSECFAKIERLSVCLRN